MLVYQRVQFHSEMGRLIGEFHVSTVAVEWTDNFKYWLHTSIYVHIPYSSNATCSWHVELQRGDGASKSGTWFFLTFDGIADGTVVYFWCFPSHGPFNNEYRLRSSLNVCGWRVYTARSSWELFATVFFNYLGNVCKNPCVRYFMFSSQTCFSTSWYCCGLPNTLNVRSLSTRWDRKATLGWVDASTCWWYPKFYQPIFMRCVLVWFPRCSF